jgi:hypothetical protein
LRRLATNRIVRVEVRLEQCQGVHGATGCPELGVRTLPVAWAPCQ